VRNLINAVDALEATEPEAVEASRS
jgi:hypothetical protein